MPLGTQEFKKYLKVSQGKIRLEVQEGTEGAEQRKVTNPSTGEQKIKHELTWTYIIGKIQSIELRESTQYGDSWSVEIDDGKEVFNLQINAATKQADDFLGRLPNIDFDKEVKISVYPSGKKKLATGLTMYQGEEKIPNYFVAYDGEKFLTKNGYPERKDDLDKDDYKIYMIQVRKFLKNYTLENVIPTLSGLETTNLPDDEIPF